MAQAQDPRRRDGGEAQADQVEGEHAELGGDQDGRRGVAIGREQPDHIDRHRKRRGHVEGQEFELVNDLERPDAV